MTNFSESCPPTGSEAVINTIGCSVHAVTQLPTDRLIEAANKVDEAARTITEITQGSGSQIADDVVRYCGAASGHTRTAVEQLINAQESLAEYLGTIGWKGSSVTTPSPDIAAATPSQHFGGEHQVPHPVNFPELAAQAVQAGLFATHPEMVARNAGRTDLLFPESLLDRPYGNGPLMIELLEWDIPWVVMDQTRKNLATVNRLLLPLDHVLSYFHERFTSADAFHSDGITHAVTGFRGLTAPTGYQNDDHSFQVKGVDRSTSNRTLYTKREMAAAEQLAHDNPELILTILAYQGTILDYLNRLERELTRLAARPEHTISPQDLAGYRRFVGNWDTPNFTDKLLPSIAIQLAIAQDTNPETPAHALVTPELLHNALTFIIDNGGFRNVVPIPAHIATNGKERVNNFLCPAVSTIRQQLLDGSLLHRIYQVTDAHLQTNDQVADDLRDKIRKQVERTSEMRRRAAQYDAERAAETAQPVIIIDTENKPWATIAGEAIARALHKNKPATFMFEGTKYHIEPATIKGTVSFNGEKQPGDIEIEMQGGESLYGTIQQAIAMALVAERPVFFSFNHSPYRIDADAVKTFIEELATPS